MWRWPLLSVLTLFGFQSAGIAQERPDSRVATVELEVLDLDTGGPLENVVVRLPALDTYLLTDSAGRARLVDITVGSHELHLTRMGYQERRGRFTVDQGGSFQITLIPTLVRADAGPGQVSGRVTAPETGQPVEGATVSIVGTSLRRVSDANGWFTFEQVAAGAHLVEIGRLGRQTVRDSIFVPDGDFLELDVPLPVDPIELQGLTVTAHPRWLVQSGFVRRRRLSGAFRGRQWTADELAEEDPAFLQYALTEVTGLRREGLRSAIYGPRGCRLGVYIDGFKMDSWFDLDHIDPRRVAGLEVYFGTPAPLGYSGCGFILVWLKRGASGL